MPTRQRIVFAFVACLLVLALVEGALRAIKFRYEPEASYMEFNFPEPHSLHNIYQPDPELLWRMRPGYDFGQGFPPLNQEGFRGPEFKKDKKAGSLRVACLGCSVTFGQPEASYPELLAQELSSRMGRPVESMNFGVPGYSTWQGRKLLVRVLAEYKPDLVIILFGWNDHWLARGFSDRDQVVNNPIPDSKNPLRDFRTYQLLNRVVSLFRDENDLPPVLRVSPEDYKKNLVSMIGMSREAEALPLLATSPSAISAGVLPDFFMAKGFIREPADLSELHDQYNRLVREVADETGVPLADLDLIFQNRDATSLFNDPSQDLIHPNARGLQVIAETLAGIIKEEAESREQGARHRD